MADFNVRGAIRVDVADAVRDLNRVQTELRNTVSEVNRLDRQLDELSRRNVDVVVDVDIRNGLRLDMLWDQLEAMSSNTWEIKVTVDAAQALLRIRQLEVMLNRLTNSPVNIDIDIQTAGAMANLTALQAQMALVASQTVNIQANVNRDMDSMSRAMGGAARSAGGLSGGLTSLIGPMAILATAIIPVVTALSGLAAGLFGAVSAVGAGLGAFAAFAIPTFSKVTKGAEALKKAQDDLANAKTADQIKAALEAQKQALSSLTPLQMQAIKNLNDFKKRYEEMAKALEPVTMRVFAEGLNFARAGLEGLFKIAGPAGDALAGVLKKASEGLKGESWTKFFDYMKNNVAFFVDTWLTGFGNIITAIGNLIVAFDPLSKSVSNGFLGMSERFLEWSKHLDTNKGFQDWIAYVKREGPGMWQTFKDIVGTLWDLAKALAPIGLKVLEVIGRFADFTNGLKESNPELYKLAVNFGSVLLVLSPLLGPLSTMAMLFVAIGPLAAGIAGAFLLLAAGLALLYTRSEEFRTAVNKLVKEGFEYIQQKWQQIKEDFDRIWPRIVDLWKIYGDDIMNFARETWETIKMVVSGALDVIAGTLKIFIGLFTGDWAMMWEGIKQLFTGGGELLAGIFKFTIDRLVLIVSLFITWIQTAFDGAWKKVSETISGWWNTAYEATTKWLDDMWTAISDWFVDVWNATGTWFSDMWEAISGWFTDVYEDTKQWFVDMWNAFSNFFTGLPGDVGRWMLDFSSAVGKGLSNAAMSVVWFAVDFLFKLKNINLLEAGKALIQGLWDGMKEIWDKMKGWVDSAMSALRDVFPFSPAKRGPFSGKGYTIHSGRALVTDFRKGMEVAAPALYSSASSILQRVNMGGGLIPTGMAVGASFVGSPNDLVNGNRSNGGGITREELLEILESRPVVVQVDSQEIARATFNGNKSLARRG